MDATPALNLPYIMPAQAQKHITHNAALQQLDRLVQLAVIRRDLSSPPEAPEDGEHYLVASGATGAWSGWDGSIAARNGESWVRHLPREGWRCWVSAETVLLAFDGEDWVNVGANPGAALQELALLGIGTSADETNTLAAKLNAALWTARPVAEGGSGDLRYVLNKETAGSVLSLLMQSGWSGRAEIGLVGNDNLQIKVSADGASWTPAVSVDRNSGMVSFPQGIAAPHVGLRAPLYVPTPVSHIYRADASRGATPRTVAIAGVSGTTVTVGAPDVGTDGKWGRWNLIAGQALMRVWNISKTPAQSAWVSASPSTTTLTVTDASHVAGWSAGETLRMGDPNPTGSNTLQMVALDISPYMQNTFGTVFPQRGVFLGFYVASSTGPAGLDFSGDGASGTAMGGNALSNGVRNQSTLPLPTPIPSPVSNSNLLFFRETLAGSATDVGIAFARILGLYL